MRCKNTIKEHLNTALQKKPKQVASTHKLKRCSVNLKRLLPNVRSSIQVLASNNIVNAIKLSEESILRNNTNNSTTKPNELKGMCTLKLKRCSVNLKRCLLPNVRNSIQVLGPNKVVNAIKLSEETILRNNTNNYTTKPNGLKVNNTINQPVIGFYKSGCQLKTSQNKTSKNGFNAMALSSLPTKSSSKQYPENICTRKPLKELNLRHATKYKQKEIIESRKCSGKNLITTVEDREKLMKLSLSKTISLRNGLLKNEVQVYGNVKRGCQEGTTIIDESELNLKIKSRETSKNIVHKTELIEQILQKEDDGNHCGIRSLDKKISKLFQKSPKNNNNNFFLPKKSRSNLKPNQIQEQCIHKENSSSTDNIYEFASISQSSDSSIAKKIDPAADIIKKLIDEGKVRVATRKKGTGKLAIKRHKIPKKRNVFKETKTKILKKKQVMNKIDASPELITAVIQNEDDSNVQSKITGLQKNNAEIIATKLNTINTSNSVTSGFLGELTRSVITSEASKKEQSRKKLSDQRRLVEAARKFVSTPLNKEHPLVEISLNLSPIYIHSSRPQNGSSSPWRVDDDAHLPSAFYFDRNSENLPTYSSDFIPSTPRKPKPFLSKNLTLSTSLISPEVNRNSNVSTISINAPETPCSSFSSNKSNAENVTLLSSIIVENNNSKHNATKPNLLRKVLHRNSLKPINILEDISLPNWKSPNTVQQTTVQYTQTSLPKGQDKNKTYDSELFGFEEFLDNDSIEEQQKGSSIDESNVDQTIRNKLHELKYLRPGNNEFPQPATKNSIHGVFDDHAQKINQIGIKEMFCSTMNNSKVDTECNVQLFNDPDPKVNFDQKQTRRTYARPFKAAKKLRHNFVMFLDSDESGDESQGHHDTSYKEDAGHNKKKHTKHPSADVVLESFVNQFNELCNEVNQYELIVE